VLFEYVFGGGMMTVLQIGGIRFKINWLFFVVMILFALVGDLARALTAFMAVFLHELGHVFMARFYGMKVKSVELLPFGGVAVYEGVLEANPKAERAVALAGPCVNFGLALGAVLLTRYHILPLNTALFFITYNVHIAIFNLIPALPLDGGRVLRATLSEIFGYRKGTHVTLRLTRVIAILAGIGAFASWLLGKVSPISLISAFFVYFAALREEEQSFYVLMKYLTRKKMLLQETELIPAEEFLVLGDTPLASVIKSINPRTFAHFLICDKDYHIMGKLSEIEVVEAFFEEGIDLPIRKLLSSR
jgi:stage IV sporulation protein FB